MPAPLILDPIAAVTPAFTWIEPSGVEHDMTVLVGIVGGLMPEIEVGLRASAHRQGARGESARFRERRLHLPLFFQEVSAPAMRAKVRQVLRWLDPTTSHSSDVLADPGTWRFTAVDGTVREAEAIYAGGLEGLEYDPGGLFIDYWKTVASFVLPHPYWRDTEDQAEAFTVALATPKGLFAAPFFPIQITSASVLDLRYLNNEGDADAWPRWTITGPAATPALRVTYPDGTTAALTISMTLAATEQILIDTEPGVKTVTDAHGNNLYQLVDGPLWPLAKGVNRVQIEANGVTSDTRFDLAYRRRWLSP